MPQGTVLVVGGGNTGFQIAKELSATHKVVLSIGSRQKPLPQRVLGRDLFWWLTKTRLLNKTVESRLGRKLCDARHADRLEPTRDDEALRRRAQATACRRRGPAGALRRRQRARSRRRHLGDRLPPRLLVDQAADLRRGRSPAPPPRRHRRCRPLLPRPHLAVHARLRADRLHQGRRRVHRREDRRVPEIEGTGGGRHTGRRRCSQPSSLEREDASRCTTRAPITTARRPSSRARPKVCRRRRTDRAGRARRRRRVRARDHPGQEADRRRDRADAGLQRLRARADAEGPAGRDDHRARHQPRRHRGDGALARAAPREPLRRHARHAGADPGRRELHLPGARARRRRLLVPPAHPRGLRPGDGLVREHPRHPERARLLAAREPRAPAHARRHPDRGRPDRRLQRVRDDARGDGPLRQRHARRRRAGPCARSEAGRGRSLLLHQHREYARLQRDAAGRADEAGRRRRRPLRARGARRRGPARPLRACRRRRALPGRRRARAPAQDARAHLPARVDHRRRRAAGAVVRGRVREPAYQPRHGRATRADRAVPQGATRQDALVYRRDGHGRARRRRRSSTSARCTPRS